jgi:hypothetical protein
MLVSATLRKFETSKDEYNNEKRDVPVDSKIKCWVASRRGGIDSENEIDREQSLDKYIIFVYGNYNVQSTDQIIIPESYSGVGEDLVLEVYGEPQRMRDRRGKVVHIEILCERVVG